MGIKLGSNIASLNALRNMNMVSAQLSKSFERLSSGYKINSAADGAAELLLSENLRSQIRGATVAQTNVQQGLSMLGVADGATQSIYSHLQRIREIATEAANGTVSNFTSLNNEYVQRLAAIDQISNGTEYNNQVLLNGSIATMTLQIGANSGDTLAIATAFADSDRTALGLAQATIGSNADGTTVLGQVTTAMNNLDGIMARIGGFQNQLQDQMNMLAIQVENYSAAESRIRNTDVAEETATMTRLQILQQASAAALAQANQQPSVALRFLQ